MLLIARIFIVQMSCRMVLSPQWKHSRPNVPRLGMCGISSSCDSWQKLLVFATGNVKNRSSSTLLVLLDVFSCAVHTLYKDIYVCVCELLGDRDNLAGQNMLSLCWCLKSGKFSKHSNCCLRFYNNVCYLQFPPHSLKSVKILQSFKGKWIKPLMGRTL